MARLHPDGPSRPGTRVSSTFVDAFRERWPTATWPAVVEHFGGEADRLAPASTLWSGAARIAAELDLLELRPGARLAVALPPGIRWVQVMVACLLREVVFEPLPPGTAAPPPGAHAFVAVDGTLTAQEAPPSSLPDADPVTWRFADGAALRASDLALATEAWTPTLFRRPQVRLLAQAPWHRPTGALACVWLGLCAGAELHVGLGPGDAQALSLTGAWPDVVVVEDDALARLLAWLPMSTQGIALVQKEPAASAREKAEARGWRVLSLERPPKPDR